MGGPELILLFSGKRKSGKDYICERLQALIGHDNCSIVRISEPLKQLYAVNHQLDLSELMSDGPYKEQYRLDMINWSDEMRQKDPGHFCRAACQMAPPKKVWIVSDIRRKTDIIWFRQNYSNTKTIRIFADSNVRESRGWIFTKGVDDVQSECDLDNFPSWDLKLPNNNAKESERIIKSVLDITH